MPKLAAFPKGFFDALVQRRIVAAHDGAEHVLVRLELTQRQRQLCFVVERRRPAQ